MDDINILKEFLGISIASPCVVSPALMSSLVRRPDAPAPDGRAHSLPAKSLGKGAGGKAGGKGLSKSARQESILKAAEHRNL